MRLLQLLPHTAAVDGIQRAGLDFTRALASTGDRSVVITMARGDNYPAWSEAADEVLLVPRVGATWRRPHQLLQVLQESRETGGPLDVVVAHRLDLLTSGSLLALRSAAPLVLHAHNAPPDWFRWEICSALPALGACAA